MFDYPRVDLVTGRFREIYWADEVGSTNTELLQAAAQGAPDGVVLAADHQSGGRGRLDRAWVAPPRASILCSALVRRYPVADGSAPSLVTMAAGMAAQAACASASGAEVLLKWPNDLLVAVGGHERKVAGLLAEAHWSAGSTGPEAIVVGVGINVNWPEDVPAELAGIAAALNHVAGHDIDRRSLLASYLEGLERHLALSPAALVGRYRGLLATLGRDVRVERAADVIVGRAVDVTEAGALIVESDSQRHVVAAGDVVHVRASPG